MSAGRQAGVLWLLVAAANGAVACRVSLYATLGGLLLAACASAGATSTSVAPATEQSPSPRPTPGLEEAGDQYLDLVRPYNEFICDFDRQFAGWAPSLATIQTAVTALADAERAWADGLRSAQWPAEVQDQVDALITGLEREEASLRAAVMAPDLSSFYELFYRRNEIAQENLGLADAVREALGIASVDRKDCGAETR